MTRESKEEGRGKSKKRIKSWTETGKRIRMLCPLLARQLKLLIYNDSDSGIRSNSYC